MTDQTVGEGSSSKNTVRRRRSNTNSRVTDDTVKYQIRISAKENAVVIFSISTCENCHTVKKLFSEVGVNPMVYELNEDTTEMGREIERVLMETVGSLPVVFIGGDLIGDMKRVMKSHVEGKLVKLIEKAG